MARNQLRALRELWDDLTDILRQSLNTAATFEIDKRKTSGKEIVAHVNHVGFRKENDAVAICMTMREVNHPNLFAVEMDGERLIERDHRQSFFRRSGSGCLEEL